MSSEQFERKLQERFAQAEIPPAPQLWNRIEAGLAPPPPSENKRGFVWLWWSMAAVVLISAGMVWINQSDLSEEAIMAQTTTMTPSPDPETNRTAAPTDSIHSTPEPSAPSPMPQATTPRDSALTPREASVSAVRIQTPSPSESLSPTQTPVGSIHSSLTKSVSMPGSATSPTVTGQDKHLALLKVHPLSYSSRQGIQEPDMPVMQGPFTRHQARKWNLDISLNSQVAPGYLPLFRQHRSESLEADFAGYANRSEVSSIPGSQIATIRFPRSYHGFSLEAGKMVRSRLRLSLGVEAAIGTGGEAGLGQLEDDASPGSGSFSDTSIIMVEPSSIQLDQPESFQHLLLRVPVNLNYIIPVGKGYFEHGIGFAANYASIRIPAKIIRELTSVQTDPALNPTPSEPVLEVSRWYADLRLRSRYVWPIGNKAEVFTGLLIQRPLTPAFRGEAGNKQSPETLGMELGLRFR